MEDLLVLVDENDNVIGTGPKLEVHQHKVLHRAFSIFLYDAETDSLLLQQRAFGKYHSGGLWSNTCCSHPRAGETFYQALPRRLGQELGMSISEENIRICNASAEPDPLLFPTEKSDSEEASVSGEAASYISGAEKSAGVPVNLSCFEYCGRFMYLADYGELAEHEIDRVFYLTVKRDSLSLHPDPDEIADLQWMSRQAVREKLQQPDYFSAWFGRAFTLADRAISLAGCPENSIQSVL